MIYKFVMDESRAFVFILILISIILIWEHYIKIISSSVFAVVLGMFVSILWKANMDNTLEFAPEIFLYLMLPPILLNSALTFKMSSLKKNWLSSLLHASFGTLFALIWIAIGIYLWTYGTSVQMNFTSALLFASILAPTDTVATISMTRSIETSDKYILEVLENESVLNDALSVVFVRLFHTMVEADRTMDNWVPIEIIGFSLISLVVAIGLAWVTALMINRYSVKNTSVHYLISLLIYGICESLDVSGILGLFVYGSLVDPPKEMRNFISSISTIIEAYVYLILGLALHSYDTSLFGISLLVFMACIIGRVLAVFIIGFILRLCGRDKWTMKSMLFFSMCGVRGAISYALCMKFDSVFMRSTTFVVIIGSILIFGSLQKCMFRMLIDTI